MMPLTWPCHFFSTFQISKNYKNKTFKIKRFRTIQIHISKAWKSSFQIAYVSKLELSSFFYKEVIKTTQFIQVTNIWPTFIF